MRHTCAPGESATGQSVIGTVDAIDRVRLTEGRL
jgi:hypothetical protein